MKKNGLIWKNKWIILAGLVAIIAIWTNCFYRINQINDAPYDTLKICFPKVSEDSDAAFLYSQDGCVVIDAGVERDASNLVKCLKDRNIKTIDLLIISHPDKDHIGGAYALLDLFKVKEVVQCTYDKDSPLYDYFNQKLDKATGTLNTVATDDLDYKFGKMEFEIWPTELDDASSNNSSLAVVAKYGQDTMFFPGDAEKKRVNELLEEGNLPTDVFLYKLPYHGRKVKNGDELFEILNPKNVVVTAKEPEEDVKEYLDESDANIVSNMKSEVKFSIEYEE